MSNFWPKKWSRSLKKFEQWSLMREFLKQHLTEKQRLFAKWSLTGDSRLREVVARRGLTVSKSLRGSFLHLSPGFRSRRLIPPASSSRLPRFPTRRALRLLTQAIRLRCDNAKNSLFSLEALGCTY